MNIADALAATPVVSLDLSRYVRVPASFTVAETVEAMGSAGRSCACVMDGTHMVGIFTQRDALMRVIGRPTIWDRPISEEMTAQMRTMSDTGSASDGLGIMNDWWVRSVPVIGEGDALVGNLSYYAVIQLIGGLLLSRLADPAGGSGVELGFVDFTGLQLHSPVVVLPSDSVATAAHHMRARAIGSVLVVDDRRSLVGMLTEFDLLTKVGCGPNDLEGMKVAEFMTQDPVALSARAPIGDALRPMIEQESSHIPLLGESGSPVGVASFRDLAAFVEMSLGV